MVDRAVIPRTARRDFWNTVDGVAPDYYRHRATAHLRISISRVNFYKARGDTRIRSARNNSRARASVPVSDICSGLFPLALRGLVFANIFRALRGIMDSATRRAAASQKYEALRFPQREYFRARACVGLLFFKYSARGCQFRSIILYSTKFFCFIACFQFPRRYFIFNNLSIPIYLAAPIFDAISNTYISAIVNIGSAILSFGRLMSRLSWLPRLRHLELIDHRRRTESLHQSRTARVRCTIKYGME